MVVDGLCFNSAVSFAATFDIEANEMELNRFVERCICFVLCEFSYKSCAENSPH